MRNSQKKTLNHGLLLACIATVTLFPFIYLLLWHSSPDNFIINSELNITPFRDAQAILNGGKYEEKYYLSLNEMNKEVHSLDKRINDVNAEKEDVNSQIARMEANINEKYKELAEGREKKIEEYKKNALKSFEERESTFQADIKELEATLARLGDPIVRQKKIEQLGSKKVALAELEVEKAQKEFEIQNQVLSNMGAFIPATLKVRFNALQQASVELTEEKFVLEQKRFEKREAVRKLYDKSYQQIIGKVGYWDFLYFSVGISTTTTFGDITTNSFSARGFTALQLIVSILLVAFILNNIMNRK